MGWSAPAGVYIPQAECAAWILHCQRGTSQGRWSHVAETPACSQGHLENTTWSQCEIMQKPSKRVNCLGIWRLPRVIGNKDSWGTGREISWNQFQSNPQVTTQERIQTRNKIISLASTTLLYTVPLYTNETIRKSLAKSTTKNYLELWEFLKNQNKSLRWQMETSGWVPEDIAESTTEQHIHLL